MIILTIGLLGPLSVIYHGITIWKGPNLFTLQDSEFDVTYLYIN